MTRRERMMQVAAIAKHVEDITKYQYALDEIRYILEEVKYTTPLINRLKNDLLELSCDIATRNNE